MKMGFLSKKIPVRKSNSPVGEDIYWCANRSFQGIFSLKNIDRKRGPAENKTDSKTGARLGMR
jgi:hypothetical protein